MKYCALGDEFSSQEAPIVVLPLPYDETCSWMKGTAKGPQAILEASRYMELYDIDTDSNVAEKGIRTAETPRLPKDPEKMVEKVEEIASELIGDGKFVVGLGGEHSVSIGLVKAQKRAHPRLSVLQLDAHSDLRDSYLGSRYNHACVMARIGELCPIVQAGIRSMGEEELERMDKKRVFFAGKPLDAESVIALLSDEVYVTIDLDVLDPSEMPSVGTPEPGGLRWNEVVELLAKVAEKKKVVGFDVVELCPNASNKAPDFLASKLTYTFLSRIFRGQH